MSLPGRGLLGSSMLQIAAQLIHLMVLLSLAFTHFLANDVHCGCGCRQNAD
jgi:hypothetical protein